MTTRREPHASRGLDDDDAEALPEFVVRGGATARVIDGGGSSVKAQRQRAVLDSRFARLAPRRPETARLVGRDPSLWTVRPRWARAPGPASATRRRAALMSDWRPAPQQRLHQTAELLYARFARDYSVRLQVNLER